MEIDNKDPELSPIRSRLSPKREFVERFGKLGNFRICNFGNPIEFLAKQKLRSSSRQSSVHNFIPALNQSKRAVSRMQVRNESN